MKILYSLFLVCLAPLTLSAYGTPVGPSFRFELPPATIDAVTADATPVKRYDKFEATVALTAAYDNPYDYDQITVSAIFTSPSGGTTAVDGFYMEDYPLSGGANPKVAGAGTFKIRFSPYETGQWTYRVSVQDAGGTTTGELLDFLAVAENSSTGGFVRTGSTNYLELNNGEQLVLIGENMAWHNSNDAIATYRSWLDKLSASGGNFIRLWHAHWGLGIEWEAGWQGFEGLRRYKQETSAYQDWLYDYCADKDIYVMLALQHHGPVSTRVNPNWEESPYNVANGGPCANPWEFFTNAEAIAHTKNRFRYIVARWGYSRAIQSWELFNEVNWTDDFDQHRAEIAEWHAEMALYLKTIDPNQHLVTTSYADADQDPEVWSNPDIDFTQTHFYINSPNLERALVGGIRDYLDEYGKPTLTGEFGLSGNPAESNADPDGIHFHNGMWGPLFGGGLGTGMTWWWDVYIEVQNLYYHFDPIRRVVDEMPFVAKNLQPQEAYVRGAPGDLTLSPNLGWGTLGDLDITINPNGTTTPATPALNRYLYGSEYNTENRSPPSFLVDYPAAGEFTVTAGSEFGTAARISIYLDDVLLLDEIATATTDYTINVPVGASVIKVDNLGTDWATISAYRFSGLGSRADVYVLSSEEKDVAGGWLLNNEYNHEYLAGNGSVPNIITGTEVVIADFAPGTYYAKWYDCLTGEIVSMEEVVVAAGDTNLILLPPPLAWDLAFRVDGDSGTSTATTNLAGDVSFTAYPNPVVAGGSVTIELPLSGTAAHDYQARLYDVAGRLIKQEALAGDQQLMMPAGLPAGLYWLKLSKQGRTFSRPIVVN